jgi:phosphoribosyl 1,2-cyclic phosphodiesterase
MGDSFRLQLKFWGVRGSIPTPQTDNLGFGGNTTCLELRLPNREIVIIDGGTGLRYLGTSLMQEFPNRHLAVNILMTHFHWDHIQGIPFFAPLYVPGNQVLFYSQHPEKQLHNILEGQMSAPYFPVTLEHMAAHRGFLQIARDLRIGDLSIRTFPMNHPQGASGYRLERDGAVIIHASDLEHGDPKFESILIEHAQNADVLVYDAQYTPEEYVTKHGWGHSTWVEAVRVAREAKVKKLILFHHDPSHDDRFLEKLVEQARTKFENTEGAVQGRQISI